MYRLESNRVLFPWPLWVPQLLYLFKSMHLNHLYIALVYQGPQSNAQHNHSNKETGENVIQKETRNHFKRQRFLMLLPLPPFPTRPPLTRLDSIIPVRAWNFTVFNRALSFFSTLKERKPGVQMWLCCHTDPCPPPSKTPLSLKRAFVLG